MRNFFKRKKKEFKIEIKTNRTLTKEQEDTIKNLAREFIENGCDSYGMHNLAIQIMLATNIIEPVIITKIRDGIRVAI